MAKKPAAVVAINLDAETAAFQTKMAASRKEMAAVGKQAKDTQGIFSSLKGSLGEESGFGNSIKLLKGAGAVAGVGALASIITSAAEGQVVLNEKIARGTA